MKLHRFVSTCLLTLILLGIVSLISPSNATVLGHNFIEEITNAPSGTHFVECDSEGRLFVLANNDVYRSVDNGDTWTKVNDQDDSGTLWYCLFVDSNDYVFAGQHNANATWTIWRSVNNGVTWSATSNQTFDTLLYGMDEFSNGTLTVNEMTTFKCWWSHDAGLTWLEHSTLNVSPAPDHLHWIEVDDYTDQLWLATGDGQYQSNLYEYRSGDWQCIANETSPQQYQTVPIVTDSEYVYFFGDGQFNCWRMLKTGTSEQDLELILHLEYGGSDGANFALAGSRNEDDDLIFVGTSEGQIWTTWDGLHWVKIYDIGNGNLFRGRFTRLGYPIYIAEATNGKLYRINVKKEDVIHLFYNGYNDRWGSVTDAENYVLEQRIWNGTNYIDLSNIALSNVQASIIGLSQKNHYNNSGFETGDKTEWTEGGSPSGTVVSGAGNVANGTYAYKITKASTDSYNTAIEQGYVSAKWGAIFYVSFYWKSNVSVVEALELTFRNGSDILKAYKRFTSPTTWTRESYWFVQDEESTSAEVQITFRKQGDVHDIWIDSFICIVFECGIAKSGLGTTGDDLNKESVSFWENIVLHQNFTSPAYFTTMKNTTDPTLTVDGETVSHSGTLTNGTESSATSLTGIKSGVLTVSANIQGSGQAILKITGTRFMTSTNIVFHGVAENTLYGIYYGSSTLTSGEKYLAVYCDTQTEITSLSKTSETLSFVLTSASQRTSTTKVYCANEGKPKQVNGATEWSYDSSLRIATLEVYHASSKTISVYWGGAGSTNFNLNVYVTENGFPTNAIVNLDGENTSIFWTTLYKLPYGTYDLTAYYGEETQTKTVGLFGDTTVGFDFTTPPQDYIDNLGPLLIIPFLIVLGIAIFTLLRRKH